MVICWLPKSIWGKLKVFSPASCNVLKRVDEFRKSAHVTNIIRCAKLNRYSFGYNCTEIAGMEVRTEDGGEMGETD